MADSLREYLIKLGFSVDDSSFKKFEAGVARAGAEVTSLGLKAVGAASLVSAAVTKIAEQYEDLYYASIRANASGAALATFAYGSRAIGISAEQAASSLERLNVELQSNPGKVALLNMLGIQTAGRDTKQIYDDLIDTLAKMPKYLQFQYGAQFGLSPSEINQRIALRGKQIVAEAEYQRKLAASGLSIQELTDKSYAYDQSLRGLGASISLVWDQTANKWMPAMTDGIKLLESWADFAVRAGNSTQGWSSTILSIVSALGALKVAAALLPEWLATRLGLSAVGGTALMAPLIGAGAAVALLNAKENQEHPVAGRSAPNTAAIAQLPWYRRGAIWAQQHLFGADPNQFVGAGAAVAPKVSQQAALSAAMSHFGQEEHVDNAALSSYFKSQGLNVDPATTAWCAAFVNATLHEAGIKGTGSLAARSFYNWGKHTDTVQAGDIIVQPHHVGIATGKFDERGRPQAVGGNTSDKVGYYYPSQYEARRAELMDGNLAPSPVQVQSGDKSVSQTNNVTINGATNPEQTGQIVRREIGTPTDLMRYSGVTTR